MGRKPRGANDCSGINGLSDGGCGSGVNGGIQTSGGIGTFNKDSLVNRNDGVVLQLDVDNDGTLNDIEREVQDLACPELIGACLYRLGTTRDSASGREADRGCRYNRGQIKMHDKR